MVSSLQKHGGNIYIPISNLSDVVITVDGIHYLKENSAMQKAKDYIKEGVDLAAKLIEIVKL